MEKTTLIKSQQEFLQHAMATLNIAHDQFAKKLGTTRRALDRWLAESDSNEFCSYRTILGN